MAAVAELLPQLDRTLDEVGQLALKLDQFLVSGLERYGRTEFSAPYIAEILEITYTVLENLFVSISQYFGYSLDEKRWHADLLNKMTLHENGVRARVLAEAERDRRPHLPSTCHGTPAPTAMSLQGRRLRGKRTCFSRTTTHASGLPRRSQPNIVSVPAPYSILVTPISRFSLPEVRNERTRSAELLSCHSRVLLGTGMFHRHSRVRASSIA